MMVGEWGVAHPDYPGMDQFVERSLQTLDRVTSGWSVWAWCRGGGYCPLDQNGAPRPGIGQIFQPYARAIAGAPTSTTWDRTAKLLQVRFSDNAATGPTDIYVGAKQSFPQGWKVETSDPDGTWSSTYDKATDVLSVTTSRTGGAHAICVKQSDAPAGCTATDPLPESTTSTTAVPNGPASATAPAAGARPVTGRPAYTG